MDRRDFMVGVGGLILTASQVEAGTPDDRSQQQMSTGLGSEMPRTIRRVVLDTETTGLDPADGHRVIEIGAVELMGRIPTGVAFHVYLNPDRDIDPGAEAVHGLSLDYLSRKPRFSEIAQDFLGFIGGAELVIHNAPFDVGFIDAELARMDLFSLENYCPSIIDTLKWARARFPGQRNSLDALCQRFDIETDERPIHGALLDAELLGEVYGHLMRGGC
jgi:DNA polymerase-3 subunit epsilon